MKKGVSKKLLKNLYIVKKKSMRAIGSELNIGKTTVEYYLKKFNIKLRTQEEARKINPKKYGWTKGLDKNTDERINLLSKRIKKAYMEKRDQKIKQIELKFNLSFQKVLNELYWNQKLSQEKISKRLGLDRGLVIKFMKEFGIHKRPKYKYISSLKGKNHSMFGRSWEDIHGKKIANERKKISSERFRTLTIRRLKNNEFPFFDTKIEKMMAQELLRQNIPFVKQFDIDNKFVCDFAIPILKIVVECDGDYWHANPEIYNGKRLTQDQEKNIKRDKIKDKYLKKKGWRIIRFFESDILKDVSGCGDVIRRKIKKNTVAPKETAFLK